MQSISWAAVAKGETSTNLRDDNINVAALAGYDSRESSCCPSTPSPEPRSAPQLAQCQHTKTDMMNVNGITPQMEMTPRSPTGTLCAPSGGGGGGVAVEKRESPKTETQTMNTTTTKMEGGRTGKVALTVIEYNAMLQKELNYRLWHNGNLSQTITRNQANYNVVELKLRDLIRSKKEEYESALDGMFGDDHFQKENVHQQIGAKLHSQKNKESSSMEEAAKVLAEGRSKLAPNQSFNKWQREIDEFMKRIKNKKAISMSEQIQIRLFALRNLVEMAKVNENRLLLELQVMAEQYHRKLGTLRLEVNWWRLRKRELFNYCY